jgi:CBS domain-containing protein
MRRISDVIKPRDIYWIEAGDTVRQAVKYLCERKTGAVAVKEGDEVVGVFSERDLMKRVVREGLNPDETFIRDVMSKNLIFIGLDDEIHLAKARMFKHSVRHLVVRGREGQYKGLVSMRDLMDADVAEFSELVHRMNDNYYEQAYNARWRMSSNRVIIEPFVSQ